MAEAEPQKQDVFIPKQAKVPELDAMELPRNGPPCFLREKTLFVNLVDHFGDNLQGSNTIRV